MPAYGASTYESGALRALVFTPGIREVLFGTLTAQATPWSGTAGEPVWPAAAEEVAVGDASQQVTFHRDGNLPLQVSLQFQFSADPGAFQIDIQVADEDVEEAYVTKGSVSTGLNASFQTRAEVQFVGRFLRLKVVALTNAVSLLSTIS